MCSATITFDTTGLEELNTSILPDASITTFKSTEIGLGARVMSVDIYLRFKKNLKLYFFESEMYIYISILCRICYYIYNPIF